MHRKRHLMNRVARNLSRGPGEYCGPRVREKPVLRRPLYDAGKRPADPAPPAPPAAPPAA